MYLWTTEAVSQGHPDKVADQISDAVLDAYLKIDENARVGCECMLMKDLIVVSGEACADGEVDVPSIVHNVLRRIGYDRPEHSYDFKQIEILDKINTQSPEIASAVVKDEGVLGAGDQGIMFGFACNETESFMPMGHYAAFSVIKALEKDIADHRSGDDWGSIFLPDAKSQVTIKYDDDRNPLAIKTVVLSTQHKQDVSLAKLKEYIHAQIIPPLKEKFGLMMNETEFIINPAGAWHFGGPAADTGLTGRKIVIDNYGPDCPVGGGAFSGKDPTKVDRSAAYMARHIAKNMVNRGAKRATVQLSYAIGMPEPVSIWTDADVLDKSILNLDLTPSGIIDYFKLRRPIYETTASGGHFGRDFPWEALIKPPHAL